MLSDFARGSVLWEAAFGALILLVALVLALGVHPLLTRVAKGLTAKTKSTLDDLLVEAVSQPLFLFFLAQGLFLALTTSTFLDRWQDYVNKVWLATMLAIAFYTIQRVVNAIIRWYGHEVAIKTKSQLDEKLLPLVRRFVTIVIYATGALLILDNLGVKLSPLIAGLGLGGLAVALALQPTLSNFIASAFVVADGAIGVGDFIELQGGPSGTVLDIGWRSTKMQTLEGNLVILPNSKVVDSIVTNYQTPTPEMNVILECGVSYESDLERAEAVCLEVARQTMQELGDSVAVPAFQPMLRYKAFGDSNIAFFIVLRAKDRSNSLLLRHEFIKRLHARLARESIEINYPVRKLVYASQDGARTPLPTPTTARPAAS